MVDVSDLVDAALVGFDCHESVTIPLLPDASQWSIYEAARAAMRPGFANADPAESYREPATV